MLGVAVSFRVLGRVRPRAAPALIPSCRALLADHIRIAQENGSADAFLLHDGRGTDDARLLAFRVHDSFRIRGGFLQNDPSNLPAFAEARRQLPPVGVHVQRQPGHTRLDGGLRHRRRHP